MIEPDVLQRVLGAALATGGQFAEVYAEDKRSSSALLDDSRVENLTSGRDRRPNIRVVDGETTGFAHTADLSEAGLLARPAQAAAAAARHGSQKVNVVALQRRDVVKVNTVATYPSDVPKATKVALLMRADESARSLGNSIVQVSASYADSRKRISASPTPTDSWSRTSRFAPCSG